MKNKIKSIGAVLAGLLVIVFLSVGTDSVLKALEVLPYDHLHVSTNLILVVLFYRAFFSLIGCYFTARLAPSNPMSHAIALGIIGLVISAAGTILAGDLGPAWYGWTLAIISVPVAWLGGKSYEIRMRRIQTLTSMKGIGYGRASR